MAVEFERRADTYNGVEQLPVTGHSFASVLDDAGAELYACRMAMDMFELEEEDLMPQIKDVISAMDFFDKSAGAQVLFI